MKHISKILFLGTLLAIQFACTDQDQLPSYKNGEAILQLCFEQPSSRTALNSAAPVQAVTEAYLYIFEGAEDNAPLVACEDLLWGKGMVQKEHRIRYDLDKSGQVYTLMAVGLDDNSKTAYQWPATPQTTDFHNLATLGEAKVKAADGQLAQLAQSEFFVGTATVKYEDGLFIQQDDNVVQLNNTPTIEMKRRVAGILLYVTDIPCTFNGTKVTRMTLEMNCEQRKELVLRRKYQTEGSSLLEEEGASFDTGSKVLMDIKLPSSGYRDGETYAIDAPPATSQVQFLENTVLKGVYLLPVENASLKICLYAEGDEAPLTSFPVKLDATETEYTLHSNHIYSIGQKLTPDNTLDDVPVSLAGDKIVLDVQDWDKVSQNVEFPLPDILFGIKPVDFEADTYIFNCIATDEGKVRVCLPEDADWTLSVASDCDWLSIRKADTSDTWEKSITGNSKQVDIQLFMKDYAVVPDYVKNGTATKEDYENDFRFTVLTLYAGTKQYDLVIKQYNAIVVKFTDYSDDDNIQYAGFSRLDYSDSFNAIGECSFNASTFGWGFENRNNGGQSVFTTYYDEADRRYDGLNNSLVVRWKSKENSEWVNSSIGICWQLFVKELSGNTAEYEMITTKISAANWNKEYYEKVWYLPSYTELYSLFKVRSDLGLNINSQNEKNNEVKGYWTSTTSHFNKKTFYIASDIPANLTEKMIKSPEDNGYKPVERDEGYKFYLRQCCVLQP